MPSSFVCSTISGVTFSVSGNKLTITSTQPIDPAALVECAKGSSGGSGESGGNWIFWLASDGSAEQIKGQWRGGIDPVAGYFKITTGDAETIPPEKPEIEYKIRIIKRVEGTGELLAGAEFEIRHTAHGVIGTYTTDSSGTLEVTVPWAGTYICTEISCPAGFVMPADPDAELYVDDDNPEAERTFYNIPYTGVEVQKIDSESGLPLSGAVIAAAIYLALGMRYGGGRETLQNIEHLTLMLAEQFRISLLGFLPLAVLIGCILMQFPSIPSIAAGIAVATIQGVIGQNIGIKQMLEAGFSGYVSNTGDATLDRLLTAGGMQAMMFSVSMILTAMMFGGIMEKTGQIEALMAPLIKRLKSPPSLVAATIFTCISVNILLPEQYIAIALPGRMYAGEYERLSVDKRELTCPWRRGSGNLRPCALEHMRHLHDRCFGGFLICLCPLCLF